jgi:hypothetical protein
VRPRASTNAILLACFCLLAPAPAVAATSSSAKQQAIVGGQQFGEENPALTPTVAGTKAKLLSTGLAAAPADAPEEVQQAVWAANEIIGKPYRYGGGHRRVRDSGYDCSGTVSYALIGAGLQDSPLDSSSFMSWGESGRGDWITVFTNPGHAYVVIAGLRLDTSAAGDRDGGKGPRWRPNLRRTRAFKARHPEGF